MTAAYSPFPLGAAANTARAVDQLLATAERWLAEVEHLPGLAPEVERRVRIAATRTARARRLLATGAPAWMDGHTIVDHQHRYVSTYCQHATALEAERGRDTISEALHHACRQACKTCQAPCRCSAPHCPCTTTRNRGNVGGATPTNQEAPHGQDQR